MSLIKLQMFGDVKFTFGIFMKYHFQYFLKVFLLCEFPNRETSGNRKSKDLKEEIKLG